ncbi:MAG TPA: hypothetical protein DCG68_03410, partial [Cryomorphaceae bacterium]|nr:hypothetical protein [Cryomorphaceae bacterium]
ITSIVVPDEVAELEKDLEDIRLKKMEVVRRQRYEEAAKLRDDEKNVEAALSKAQARWEEDLRENRQPVT